MASIEDALNQPRRAGEPGYEGGEPSSRKIQSDIDRTRSNMDRTFDAIESKLTPGQLLQEAWGIFKGGSGAGASKVMKIAKQHPLPSAVIGLGIGWLLLDSSRATSSERSRQSYAGNLDYPGTRDAWSERWPESRESEGEGRLGAAKDALKSAAGSAADLATNAREKVSDLASQAGDRFGDLTDRVKEQASDLTDKVKEQASELGTKVEQGTRQVRLGFWQLLEERPLAVGAATLAVGLLAGLSIPSTDVEDELMGETRDQLFDSAKETGRELLDKGKHVADAAVDAVQQTAEKQNLSVDSLTDKVKTVANEAREAIKTEARNQHLTPETPVAGEQAQAKPGQPQGQPAQKAAQPAPPQGAKQEVREPELVKR
jgi:ElaB/YqjD/DUF883 family membrane-anchored ribosome-binding protein